MNRTKFTVGEDKKTLVVERQFAATKSNVWRAYTDPELLRQWWGPKGWTTDIKHMDFSVGGYWHYCMRCIDKSQGDFFGMESWGKGTYTGISPEDSFSYDDEFCDERGNALPGMPMAHVTISLTAEKGSTLLTCTSRYDTADALTQVLEMGMEQGFTQTLDNLETVLSW